MSRRISQQVLSKFYTGETSQKSCCVLPKAWSYLQSTPTRRPKIKMVYKIPQKAKEAKIGFNYSEYRKLFKI